MTDENFASTEAINIHTNKRRGVTIGMIEGLLATESREMIDSRVEDKASNAAAMIDSCVSTIRAETSGGMNRVRT